MGSDLDAKGIESRGTIPLPPVHLTWYVRFLSFFAAIGGFLFGYDTGIISGATLFIQEEFSLNHVQIEMVVGATTLGAIFGGVIAGYSADRVGRKPVTFVSSILFLAGALTIALAQSYGLLLAGRFIVGLGVGLASMVAPMYISEVAPKDFRGRLVTVNVLLITGGQLIAYLVAAGLTNVHNGWRIMIGIAAAPAVIQLIGLPFLPESPRFLHQKGRTPEALAVLSRVYGASDIDGLRASQDLADMDEAMSESAGGSYRDLFTRPENYRPLLVACLLQALQQFSGFNTAMYYAATILRMAGFRSNQDAITFSILVAGTNMLCTLIALRFVDRLGRRRILLWTVSSMAIGLFLLGGAFVKLNGLTPYQDACADYGSECGPCVSDDRCAFTAGTCKVASLLLPGEASEACPGGGAGGWFALASLVFYVASYALGLGHVPWLVQSEMFSGQVRGRAAGVATGVNWVGNLIVSVTFLSLTHAISAAGTFWLYGGIAFVGILVIFRWMPETKGRSLEEIRELFLLDRSSRIKASLSS